MAPRKEKIEDLKAQAKKLAEEAAKLEKKFREDNMMKIGRLILDKYHKNDFANFELMNFKSEIEAIVSE